MPKYLPVRDLLSHIIGGGWGSDSSDEVNEQQVAIIRGADFPQVQIGNATSLPIRFESRRRVATRRLQAGDIVLEISGGTNERPTGRSVFASESLLAQVPVPVIPASFCRLLRPNSALVEPRYLYFWLQDMYAQGRTWAYQVRSTGIANFQTEYFLDHEVVALPPIQEQRRIAGVLGALDDLIEVNRRLIRDQAELITSVYRWMINGAETVAQPLFEAFEIDFGAAFKGTAFSEPGLGLPLLRIRDLKTFSSDTWTTERINGDVLVSAGDVVVGMDAEFRPTFWLGRDSLLNQRVCRVRPKEGGVAFVRESMVKPLAFIEGHKTGTTVSHLNKADLSEILVPIPDQSTRAQFDLVAEPLRVGMVQLYQECCELESIRDELLPLLMSGRIRVGEDVAA